ncbi:Prophage integrase IntS [Aliiroseovarius sp. xm-v-225]|uniref:tyrosine-type recombinase/integrase n=1 Tax=unclassified Aliiroseovarius TaxID=2623558 RepID=UPI001588C1A9|nr:MULTISPECIES: integrase family protein [unclassified Aliiroseovarius]NRP45536.1 Prophage integrase IntS [Aliiroseovarius sp. xm-m-378]NRP66406.1 Prophage integrase IntS [Aliiroseovarius sp. xm-v-225]NRP93430.1 Prophage integrase IntS [Aliiroseovarius sp. xm-a-134]
MKFTDASVRNVKPTEDRQEIPDDLLPGMYLIVQPTGRKSWKVRYRAGGKHRRMTLGNYPDMSLAEARRRAREVKQEAQAGRDPAAEVKAAKTQAPQNTLAQALDDYARRKLKHLKSGELVRRELDRFARKAWGERQLSSIDRREIQDLIDGIADSGRGPTANRVLAYLKAFLSWCCDRGLLDVNPADRVKKAVKEKARNRRLDNDEIRWFWMACDEEGYPWGQLGQLLLLTGQRLNEIAQLTKGEINGESIDLPRERTKNARPHTVPLSEMAFDIVEALPVVQSANGYLFTTNGQTPVQGFSKAHRRLAGRMVALATAERGEPVEIPHWTFHDLRRTCASALAFYARIEVMEKILNHVSGKLGGVTGVYNRHEYSEEMRNALEAWSGQVRGVLGNDRQLYDLKTMAPID